ncbi:MAG: septum formation initiator family protein [Erysipelotrichaceae bacterium]|nr:septum formation initiator family protein [Erysipelotrichaceae bacterium]
MKNAKRKSGSKKKRYNPMKKFFSVFLVMVGCCFTYMSAKEIITMMQLQQEIKQTEAEIEALKTEQTRLEDQKEKFSDEEYVKRYARGKFLLSKEGETLYKLNGQESSNNNEANTDKE